MSRRAVDAACALALFAFTAGLAFWTDGQFRQSGLRAGYYQEEFAPAVMVACGHGFINVIWGDDPALKAFLLQQRPTLTCGELRAPVRTPANIFQIVSRYLEVAVGITWRLAGISWAAVTWLEALLAGLFGAAAYGVMRLGMRPLASAIVSVMVVTSPLHLSNLPHLRDYSKAPFLLALVLLMGIAVKRTLTWRQLLGLSAVGGVVAGVGFGFRTDLLLAMVPFVVTLLVFRAGSLSTRSGLLQGAAASVVFVATFAVTAAPVLRVYVKSSASAHVILLGFGRGFNSGLGVEAKHYELSAFYDDGFQETVVRSYASRVEGDARPFSVGSEQYDRASTRYLMRVIQTFPADVAVRTLSAALQVLDTPFSTRYLDAGGWVHNPSVTRLYAAETGALRRLGFLGWMATAIVVAGVAASSVRRAAFLMFILLFLGGGAALQFQARHFFYLEFMPWWAVGVMVSGMAAAVFAIPRVIRDPEWRARRRLTRIAAGAARSAAVVTVAVLAMTVVLGGTRRYQQRHMNQMFERTLAAAAQPLTIATVPAGADRVTMTVDLPELVVDPAAIARRSIATAYLVIDLNPQRCDSWRFSPVFRYETTGTSSYTTSVNVPLVDPQIGSSVKILMPVYAVSNDATIHGRFTAIDLSATDARCVASIAKVSDVGAFPVLVTAVLSPDWRNASHYQTLTGVETREDGAVWDGRLYAAIETLEVGRLAAAQPMADFWPDAVVSSRTVVRVPPAGMAVAGTPEAPHGHLVQSRARAISRGTCAIAQGELTAGALTFGLLRDGQWYQQVGIVDRGRFVAIGCAREDGNYAIVLANNNAPGGVTAARLTKIGWVPGGQRGSE